MVRFVSDKVLLVSGGVDSFVAFHKLRMGGKEPLCVFVNYGQLYYEMEFEAVRALYGRVTEVKVDGLPKLGVDVHVPARNLMFATIGVRFASEVVIAGVGDEICSDKSVSEFRNMSRILSKHCGFSVKVSSPLWGYTKESAVAEYLVRGGDVELLRKTVSCYSAELCGDCEACFRRAIALACNGVIVPLGDRVIGEQVSRLHMYDQARQSSIIRGIRALGKSVQVLRLSMLSDNLYVNTVESGYGEADFHILSCDQPKFRLVKEVRSLASRFRFDNVLYGQVC